MMQLRVWLRPLAMVLAFTALATAVVPRVMAGSAPVHMAGDDPKVPSGG